MAQITIANARTLERCGEDPTQADVKALSADYFAWTRDDIEVMRATLGELERALSWNDGDAAEGLSQSLLATAQALSEQAGTFGFTLIAEIADSLCTVLARDGDRVAHLEAHLAALEGAVALGLRGDGGAVGVDLITRLSH